MLRQLRLQNFRCFDDHTIIFETNVVAVGKNNAGKSSVIEALRILASVINRRGATFVRAPQWLELPRFQSGIAPGISHLELSLASVFHRYGDPPAIVTATFKSGVIVTIYVGREQNVFATVQFKTKRVTKSSEFLALKLPWVHVLPQIGPLLPEEYRIRDERVLAHLDSRLASRHFRNQLLQFPAAFDKFKKLAEETWNGLRVDEIQQSVSKSGTLLSLPVRDGDFVAEVGWMGHGLQMWLQTIWFISRTPLETTIVLDEPDVYMHPDLQRKLYRLIRARFCQSIIATHSVEIMAESDPSRILVIDKKERRSRYANNEPGVQVLIDQIGGIHNVHLARLWNARKFLLVEGNDISLLRPIHSLVVSDSDTPLDALPALPIGGWGGWPYAVGSTMALRNAVGERIRCYCILDSDYHTNEEISERYEEAVARGVYLHVWSCKEIENYFLLPRPIRRVLAVRQKDGNLPSEEEILTKILSICDEERHDVEDGFASSLLKKNRRLDVATANRMARDIVNARWEQNGCVRIVSGKQVLSRLSEWTQREFGVSFGAPAVVRQITALDVQEELKAVLRSIEEGSAFASSTDRESLVGKSGAGM